MAFFTRDELPQWAQSRLTLVAKADAQQLNHAIYAIGPFR